MVTPFKFLTHEEFEKLGPKEKLKYLSDAMVELGRIKGDAVGWDGLFKRQDARQTKDDENDQKGKPE